MHRLKARAGYGAAELRGSGAGPRYRGKRAKLELLNMAGVEELVLGKAAPSDMLLVLVVLADWNPLCARVDSQVGGGRGWC